MCTGKAYMYAYTTSVLEFVLCVDRAFICPKLRSILSPEVISDLPSCVGRAHMYVRAVTWGSIPRYIRPHDANPLQMCFWFRKVLPAAGVNDAWTWGNEYIPYYDFVTGIWDLVSKLFPPTPYLPLSVVADSAAPCHIFCCLDYPGGWKMIRTCRDQRRGSARTCLLGRWTWMAVGPVSAVARKVWSIG